MILRTKNHVLECSCAKNGDGSFGSSLRRLFLIAQFCELLAGSSAFVTNSSRVREEIQAVLLRLPGASHTTGETVRQLGMRIIRSHYRDPYQSNIMGCHILFLNSCDQANHQTTIFGGLPLA